MKTAEQKRTGTSERPGPDTDEILREIEAFIKKKFSGRDHHRNTRYYQANFAVDGPADMLITMSALIKVCIMALERAGNGGYSKLIPQPHITVQTALEFILQLAPFDEIKCLESILEVYRGTEETPGK
ncbi:hypothetical protein LS482_17135 [Sinomicrobium kalidii]|uniref:hypothetical protein n=1 Tax=Sinomicrobium kalidii TaxID=2900738 RepID=UPI001E296C5C|nr:hypothetical protein [Sinomicrobium kalidii]UGU15393.1 hypothetical protein LS482_17135 [Sinomicrobium kalidii]